jgi:hypothetical protein
MKTQMMCRISLAIVCLALPALSQERWELGFGAGYGFYKNVTATNAAGEASVGFKPGVAFTAVAGNAIKRSFGGEVRYTYRQNDAFVSRQSTEARFDAESHALHYDLIFLVGNQRATLRPFLAAGAGVKIYRGTGREAAFQPLSSFVALTRTTQIAPLVSVGGGFKMELSPLLTLRIEARDYASTFPSDVVAPVPGARVSGWVHDIVPMIGLSFNVGR